ncbi:PREDICTED: serine protease inhibitor 1-like [Nicotiana attenuata]|uniref:21 kDa seed protein n=1 Tax=Nicotiana attenuata TaxID=49451 RepID=A0A1J6KXC1_NICAT|nr:PREDICTED: serine protease inhibitor 1-like [Nicotiana attenuata]OIT27347.1 21 kda seed protein [Nicotiana attenuata]
MKSFIFSFLLLSTTLALLPFVVFSSSFTSTNPIVLPTTTDDDKGFPISGFSEVLDINGEPLHVGEEYHIISAIRGAGGGGVYLTYVGNTKCPSGVLQHWSDTRPGMPVKFVTTHSRPFNVVRENTDINIMFSVSTSRLCVNETVWKVGDPDLTARGTRFVVTGGTLGNPGPETINSWFKIEKVTKQAPFYKLRYCPDKLLCPECHPVNCLDVGVTDHFGRRRLALTNQPFMVFFRKFQKTDG